MSEDGSQRDKEDGVIWPYADSVTRRDSANNDSDNKTMVTDGGTAGHDGGTHHYIGENDCKVATCTSKQEFPDADDPYCVVHSLGSYKRDSGVNDAA